MPKVFISYRRDDTSGEAGRLANDLGARFGRTDVFMDIDAIAPGANFEDRIAEALQACQVALILIGKRWLSASNTAGQRRLDEERDYVRLEIQHALGRSDVVVVPVLVEGATMPAPDALPADIALLSKLNAAELTNRRWREDVRDLAGIAERSDGWWRRAAGRLRTRGAAIAGAVLLVAGVAAALVLSKGGGSDQRTTTTRSSALRPTLLPAAVPPKVDVCSRKLTFAVDGTVAPLGCTDGTQLTNGPTGGINSLAWQYFANGNLLVMSLSPTATPGRVEQALCSDLRSNRTTTIPKETQAYKLATAYYGWNFTLPFEVDKLSC